MKLTMQIDRRRGAAFVKLALVVVVRRVGNVTTCHNLSVRKTKEDEEEKTRKKRSSSKGGGRGGGRGGRENSPDKRPNLPLGSLASGTPPERMHARSIMIGVISMGDDERRVENVGHALDATEVSRAENVRATDSC